MATKLQFILITFKDKRKKIFSTHFDDCASSYHLTTQKNYSKFKKKLQQYIKYFK